MASVTIVGLGPGGVELLTLAVWRRLQAAQTLYLRTRHHPAVDELPAHLTLHAFDALYETLPDYESVYAAIAETIMAAAAADDVLYAVPGHPAVGERSVQLIQARAREAGIAVSLIDGMSFIAPTLRLLALDGLDGLQLMDANQIIDAPYPPVNPDMPLLVSQVYSRLQAGDLKIVLADVYGDEHPVVLVHGAGTEHEQREDVPLYAIDRSPHLRQLTSLYVPPAAGARSLTAFAASIATLRGPDGCPWDQEQTAGSMRSGFIEEVAEAIDAIDRDDVEALCDELGDVLLHIVFQAQIAREAGDFTLSDVVGGIEAKIRRRHPHVWGETVAESASAVEQNWRALKALEKDDEPRSILANIPPALSALARAQKIQRRVARVGFDWPAQDGVWRKLVEEMDELAAAGNHEARRAELGDLLFSVVNLARWMEIDAETALREANLRFEERFSQVELLASEQGQTLDALDIDALEALWQEAKRRMAGGGAYDAT